MNPKAIDQNRPVVLVNYTGRRGGGPLYAYEMAKAFAKQGVPLAAVISEEIENRKAWEQLPIEKLIVIPTYTSKRSFIKNHLQFVLYKKYQVRKELEQYTVKVVYCPMCTFWTDSINRLFPKAKKIAVCHDPVLHSGEKYACIHKICGVEHVYRKADEIIVLTKKFTGYMERRYKKAGHVHVMTPGRHNYYRNIKKKHSAIVYEKDKTNFLFFGRISAYKGLGILADAYKIVCSRYQDVTLTVAGAGDFRPYRKKFQNLERVTVLNRWIADDEVESIFMGENLIVVLPYTDATQSGVILVATDYGVPVIAADTGGLDEQIEDGVTGLLTAVNDSACLAEQMIRLKNDRNLYEKICINMKKKRHTMEWADMAEEIMRLMSDVHSFQSC